MSETNLKPACNKRVYKIAAENLPLSCPMPDMILWNAHPKVYLPIEKTEHARCPYCSAEYLLMEPTSELTSDNNIDVEYTYATH